MSKMKDNKINKKEMIKLKRSVNVLKGIILIFIILVLITNLSIIIQIKTNPDLVPSIFGYKMFIVLSGSMEEQINIGDLVIVKQVDSNFLEKGDIITFRDSGNIVTTHRIVDIKRQNDELCFITKGDKNNVNDEEVIYSDMIEGKYQAKISNLGNVILFIQKLVGVGIILFSILVICNLIYMFQNTDKDIVFEDECERKAFEEFMKERKANKEKNKK